MTKEGIYTNRKICEKFCDQFNLDLNEFPRIVYDKKVSSVNMYLRNYLNIDLNDPEFKGLDRVEEIFLGLPDLITILCEILFSSNKKNEAKGIFLRHKLKY